MYRAMPLPIVASPLGRRSLPVGAGRAETGGRDQLRAAHAHPLTAGRPASAAAPIDAASHAASARPSMPRPAAHLSGVLGKTPDAWTADELVTQVEAPGMALQALLEMEFFLGKLPAEGNIHGDGDRGYQRRRPAAEPPTNCCRHVDTDRGLRWRRAAVAGYDPHLRHLAGAIRAVVGRGVPHLVPPPWDAEMLQPATASRRTLRGLGAFTTISQVGRR